MGHASKNKPDKANISNISKISTCSLSSGSSGNCILIKSGGASILIDAGISARNTVESLASFNVDITSIDAIFITHEHIDHVKGLKVISSKYKIPVYMIWESFNSLHEDYKFSMSEIINFISPQEAVAIGDLTVECYQTPHDSAASVGYIIKQGDQKFVGIATDIGCVTDEVIAALSGCEIIYIESNHDLEMLKMSSYPANLKRRIKSKQGHLSNVDCAKTLPVLIKNGTRKILLYHLSKENNTREIAFMESRKSIIEAKLNVGTIFLGVAPQFEPSQLLEIHIEI